MDNSQNSNTDVDEPDTDKAKKVMNTDHSEIEDTDVRDDDSRTYEEAWKMNKRDLMKGMGAAGATAAVGGVSMEYPAVSPVQEAEALVPAVAAGVGIGLVAGAAVSSYYQNQQTGNDGEGYQEEKSDSASTDIFRDGSYQDGLLEQRDILRAINQARDKLEQTVPLSLAETKTIAIRKRANGATKSEANTAVLKRMREYFAGVFKALYLAQERQVLLLEGWVDRIGDIYTNENNGDPLPFCGAKSDASEWNYWGPESQSGGYTIDVSDGTTFEDVDIELLNGEVVTLRRGTISLEAENGQFINNDVANYGEDVDGNPTAPNKNDEVIGVHPSYSLDTYAVGDTLEKTSPAYIHFAPTSKDSDSNGTSDWEQYHDLTDSETVDNEIQNAYEIAKNEITTLVTDVYNNYSQSEAEEAKEDFISPVSRLLNQSEKYLETGDPAFAEAVAYEMGTATSDPKISLIVRYEEYDGSGGTKEPEEMVGQFIDWTPENENIEVGKTYDTDDISEEVRFLQTTDGGEVQERVLDGKFTVVTPENSNDYNDSETRYGPSDKIPINKPPLASRDISDLKSQFRDTKKARDDYDTAADSGGTGLGITGNAAVDLGIVGTVGAVLYYLFRGKSGSA